MIRATSADLAEDAKPASSAASVSASMAAWVLQSSVMCSPDHSSLAAYGIDPSAAVAAENPEDGGVEEEDDEDEDSDDEDDVKFVFSGQAQRVIDNR